MERDDAVAEELHHFDRVLRAEVGRPESVELELDLRAEFRIDFVFQTAVDALEFPVVVVLEEHETGFFEFLLHHRGGFGGALDGVEVLVVLRAVAADDAVEAEAAGDVDGLFEIVRLRPGGVRAVKLEPEVVDPLEELFRRHVPEAGRLNRLEADIGNGFQHGVKVLFRHLAQ